MLLRAIRPYLNTRQVADMFLSQDWRGNNVLMVAVASRSRGVLEVTLGSVLRSLSDEQVCDMLQTRDCKKICCV